MAIDGVSIIISAYKASEFIEECLLSITRERSWNALINI